MPLFVAAVVAARNGRTTTVPVHAPPLWLMLLDEAVHAARSLPRRLRRWGRGGRRA